MAKILLIDDEASIRQTLKEILEYEKYEVEEVANGADGFKKIENEHYDLVLCDIKMPKMDGMELLNEVYEKGIEIPFIMISAHGTIDNAVEATKKGAFDFISKPPDLNRLLVSVRNALDKSTLMAETKTLRKKVSKKYEMIGSSKELEEVKGTIAKVAPTDARVLIIGENGTGKELVARQIHEQSDRAKLPMVEVNCAAIPSELIESELFGHEKGSFTSAVKQRIGKFEQATGGTLFLDEIGDMPLAAQAKVLRALQESKINRVGGDKDIKVDVRIIAATNKNLKEAIDKGEFREDLFHRLSVIRINVPPLKERKEDIPELVERFLGDIAEEHGSKKKSIDKNALNQLKEYSWGGNIRELRNVVERLIILGADTITAQDVKKYIE
ncbi:DNA-binding transcriptional response regulator, NtrC family, contains REC, AAA-type ATPase, and a Fis-type DNA-binding domains [Marivirga sericea]|uniref:DNA-binding transcriptional response regulator, NtrC family, contains REC, AAA-type ATPase, and a Fis-type DNA-binding domains n=1 Tax=Marivirga sericea TaxID=1028 RepID=A0A1X7KCR8_9BACT|nr:sigma-54 dependent transcriptional regulator [Marivirga sericea]SMG38924.1 DNA-binding transcriptional response regulator, NtrC family, contains REC, AAA-type ATPase, and a Fis-type DNA-binding domains [Marivirga sericea]